MSPELLAVRKERARLLAEELARETGVPVEAILGRHRDPQVVAVRHRLWALLRESGLSYPAVAAVVGVDHTSVMAAVRKTQPRKRVRVA